MPNLTKANNTTAMNLSGSWVENIAPNSTATAGYDAIFDSTASSQSTGSIGATVFFGTVNLQTTGSSAFTVSTAASSYNFNVYGPVTGGASSYSVFVAANKTLNLPTRLLLWTTRGVEPVVNHTVYVDSGGLLCLNSPGTSANNGNVEIGNTGSPSLTKDGPGVFYTGRSTSAPSWVATAVGTFIKDGTIRLDGATGTNPLFTTPVNFSPDTATRNPTLEFVIGNGSFTGTTRSLPNNIVVNASGAAGGRILVASGFTATFTGTATGSGTLTIAGAGGVTWNNNISCPLNVTGLLTLGSTYNLSGSTLSGDGTIATNGSYTSTISSNAPSFNGSVSGDFNYSGTNKTFDGQITGTVKVDPNSSVTFSRTGTHTGALEDVKNGSTVTVRGTFAGGTSSTYADVWYTATLIMDGPNANVSGAGNPNISVWDKGTLWLTGGATVTPLLDLTYDGGGGGNAGSPTIGTNDTNTNTYSGTLSCSGSPARGSVKLLSKTDGVLVLSGTAVDNGANTRPFAINGDSGYAGTVRLTGGGFNTPTAPVNLLSGKLHINRAGAVALGSGLTVSSNAVLACSSNGAYAAQLAGAITLNSGAIMQFGAP